MLLRTAIILAAIVLRHAQGLKVPSVAVQRVATGDSRLDSNVDRGCSASWRSSALPAETATPRFTANVAEARRLREALPLGEAGAALLRAGLLEEQVLEGWVAPTERLATSLACLLGLEGGLEALHCAIPDFSPDRDAHSRVTKAKIRLQHPVTDAKASSEFHAAFESLICEHVAPHVAAACSDAPALRSAAGGRQTLWYACVPTIRVQTPSEEQATIRPHVDGMYDLPDGSINFWLPLTTLDSTSTLWVESVPGREDFHPLTGATRFDGRRCLHFTLPNHSSRTRVSLDFRCVPGALHTPEGRLARAGYFSSVVRDASGRFVPGHRGQATMLHGLPHTKRPPGWKQPARKPKSKRSE
jgi:hypothetical protein